MDVKRLYYAVQETKASQSPSSLASSPRANAHHAGMVQALRLSQLEEALLIAGTTTAELTNKITEMEGTLTQLAEILKEKEEENTMLLEKVDELGNVVVTSNQLIVELKNALETSERSAAANVQARDEQIQQLQYSLLDETRRREEDTLHHGDEIAALQNRLKIVMQEAELKELQAASKLEAKELQSATKLRELQHELEKAVAATKKEAEDERQKVMKAMAAECELKLEKLADEHKSQLDASSQEHQQQLRVSTDEWENKITLLTRENGRIQSMLMAIAKQVGGPTLSEAEVVAVTSGRAAERRPSSLIAGIAAQHAHTLSAIRHEGDEKVRRYMQEAGELRLAIAGQEETIADLEETVEHLKREHDAQLRSVINQATATLQATERRHESELQAVKGRFDSILEIVRPSSGVADAVSGGNGDDGTLSALPSARSEVTRAATVLDLERKYLSIRKECLDAVFALQSMSKISPRGRFAWQNEISHQACESLQQEEEVMDETATPSTVDHRLGALTDPGATYKSPAKRSSMAPVSSPLEERYRALQSGLMDIKLRYKSIAAATASEVADMARELLQRLKPLEEGATRSNEATPPLSDNSDKEADAVRAVIDGLNAAQLQQLEEIRAQAVERLQNVADELKQLQAKAKDSPLIIKQALTTVAENLSKIEGVLHGNTPLEITKMRAVALAQEAQARADVIQCHSKGMAALSECKSNCAKQVQSLQEEIRRLQASKPATTLPDVDEIAARVRGMLNMMCPQATEHVALSSGEKVKVYRASELASWLEETVRLAVLQCVAKLEDLEDAFETLNTFHCRRSDELWNLDTSTKQKVAMVQNLDAQAYVAHLHFLSLYQKAESKLHTQYAMKLDFFRRLLNVKRDFSVIQWIAAYEALSIASQPASPSFLPGFESCAAALPVDLERKFLEQLQEREKRNFQHTKKLLEEHDQALQNVRRQEARLRDSSLQELKETMGKQHKEETDSLTQQRNAAKENYMKSVAVLLQETNKEEAASAAAFKATVGKLEQELNNAAAQRAKLAAELSEAHFRLQEAEQKVAELTTILDGTQRKLVESSLALSKEKQSIQELQVDRDNTKSVLQTQLRAERAMVEQLRKEVAKLSSITDDKNRVLESMHEMSGSRVKDSVHALNTVEQLLKELTQSKDALRKTNAIAAERLALLQVAKEKSSRIDLQTLHDLRSSRPTTPRTALGDTKRSTPSPIRKYDAVPFPAEAPPQGFARVPPASEDAMPEQAASPVLREPPSTASLLDRAKARILRRGNRSPKK